MHRFARALTSFGTLTSRPEAFLIVLVYVMLWAIVQPHTLDWHGIATIATWLMTLVIQRSEHRDTQALHAKLDELLRAYPRADTSLEKLDDAEPEVGSARHAGLPSRRKGMAFGSQTCRSIG